MVVGALTVEVVVLAVSGLWLVFYYRPSSAAAWGNPPVHLHHAVSAVGAIRLVHRLTAALAIPTSIVAAALVVIEARTRHSGWRKGRAAVVAGPGLAILALAASFTGYLLPWDQLALWSVTVGSDLRGYPAAFGGRVQFVLIGGSAITKATLWRWFIVHTVVLSSLLILALVIAWHPRPVTRETMSEQ
jgi:quinol-cytochrome oxidoreductase complex cytochrome b subunit